MVKEMVDRHPKLKRGDSKAENVVKTIATDNSSVYHKVVEFEEQEALSRSGDDDLKLFKECCEKFRQIILNVGEMKIHNEKEHGDGINNCRIDGSLIFMKMKKLNRLEKFRLNSAREKLYDTKRQVDNFHLQWQNLLYETHHLKKEITKCLSFKSKDEHIELIPVEDFYKNAPQSIARPEITRNDPHQLRLARLEWELKQRKMLAEMFHDLEEEKQQVTLDIRRRKDRIENLVPMIRNILTVTKPVQEHLSLPMSQIQTEPELAQLLPPPLYFLSIQVDAMREACDSLIKITISGDKEAATRFNNNITELTTFDESDSDEETKNHHHRRKTKKQIREEKIKKLLMKHPLSVNIHVFLKDKRNIVLSFTYLINLRIITVMPSLDSNIWFEGICCRYLLEPRNILNGLFDQDYGDQSPNAANNYQLQQLGLEFNVFELGIPYLWAQKLCGLDFTGRTSNENFVVDAKTNAAQRNLSSTVTKIRRHFQIVVDLCEQLQDFEKLCLPTRFKELTSYPVKISCSLTKWSLLSWDQLNSRINIKHLTSVLHLSEHDRYFETSFIRNAARLTAVIILKPDYPNVTPVFIIQVENAGVKYTAENDTNVRDMEKEVNLYVDELYEKLEKKRNWILTAQIYKLAVCFDIYLECTDSLNFPREKLFLFHVRGRARSLPFKFTKQGSEGLFVQR